MGGVNHTLMKQGQVRRGQLGYVLDTPYTWSYYKYMSPLLLSYVARLNGFRMPSPDMPFTYCDLGCGNGVTINLLAAAYPHAQFYGVDFNPDHIRAAQAVAEQAGLSNVTFITAPFSELDHHDLPQFDFIAMQGVYSWVGGQIRIEIRAAIDKLLKPGGMVYLCYNTLPGASHLIPIWKMMHVFSAGVKGGSVDKARHALKQIVALRKRNTAFFRENSAAGPYVDNLAKRDPRYLVHDFFNGCYEPQYFADVASGFADLGLRYSGSARLYRNNFRNIVSSRHSAHVEQTESVEEQMARLSLVRNESFRWDTFIRAREPVAESERGTLFDDLRVAPTRTGAEIIMSGTFSIGRRHLTTDTPLIAVLMECAYGGKMSVAEILSDARLSGFDRDEALSAMHDLLAGEVLQTILRPYADVQQEPQGQLRFAERVSLALLEARHMEEGKTYVSAPALGAAVRLSFMNGLVAWATDCVDMPARTEHIAVQLTKLTPQRAAALGLPEKLTRGWINEQVTRFDAKTLPWLIQTGVFVTDHG